MPGAPGGSEPVAVGRNEAGISCANLNNRD
jgi:hypothetical protein